MKIFTYILVLLLGTCWILSSQEERGCVENVKGCEDHVSSLSTTNAKQLASPHDHANELGGCHFGHCGHMVSLPFPIKLSQLTIPALIYFSPYLLPETLETPFISYRPPSFA